jgi:hypothetical protein
VRTHPVVTTPYFDDTSKPQCHLPMWLVILKAGVPVPLHLQTNNVVWVFSHFSSLPEM